MSEKELNETMEGLTEVLLKIQKLKKLKNRVKNKNHMKKCI